MAKIKKIQESGETIYPATIFQAIKNPKNGQTLEKSFESEHKKLTAGFAYEILGDGQATNEKFSFRPTGGPNRNVRDGSARIEVLKGNSVVWNQGIKPSSLQHIAGGLTGYYADGKWNWSGTANRAAAALLPQQSYGKGIAGHTVIMLVGGNNNFNSLSVVSYADSGNENFKINTIYTLKNNSNDIEPVAQLTVGNTYEASIYVHFIDLTQMFGTGNEPTTVEQFYELLPEGVDINAYNEGEIVDANYKAIKTTGLNQWDEQWELGGIGLADGKTFGTNVRIRSKNYNPALPNTKYRTEVGSETALLFWYDKSYNFISYSNPKSSNSWTSTSPANAAYFKLCMFESYGATYKGDICVRLSWPEYTSLNGTYKPYKPFERDLSWANKYFPATINGETKYGMRSAGNVADEIRFNSTTQQWEAVQRVGVVDLGSLTWGYGTPTGSYELFYTSANSIENALYYGGGVLPNAISELYMPVTANLLSANGENNTFTLFDGNKRMMVRNTSYTDAETFKAAMDGVILNYELAEPIVTPITEDINLAYDVADYGTEQLIVADGAQSAPLSAEIVYEPNVLASIKQVAAMLTRLDALETAVATMQASAVATTNEE